MPWIKNADGTDKYIVSLYAKEELPTWDEIYNQFWKHEVFEYDPYNNDHMIEGIPESSDPGELIKRMDLYWKLPHRQVLLGWICNQLNKMLFEDGQRDRMIEVATNVLEIACNDIRFWLLEVNPNNAFYDLSMMDIESGIIKVGTDTPPPVITCELPSTGQRSMFASKHPSVNIKTFTYRFKLGIVLRESNTDRPRPYVILTSDNPNHRYIISELLTDVRNYFEGDRVGWKDIDGNVMPTQAPLKRGCDDSGSDPAL